MQCLFACRCALQDLYGKTLNFVTFKQAINTLDKWYHDRGILGQVRAGPWPLSVGPRPAVWLSWAVCCHFLCLASSCVLIFALVLPLWVRMPLGSATAFPRW